MGAGTVTLYVATSLDGFVATADGGVEWLDAFQSESTTGDAAGSFESFFAGVDCLVMGSRTYEQVLGFGDWPYGEKPTYVTTRRNLPLATDSVELFDGDVADLTSTLKTEYEHVWLVGGAALAQSFLGADLVDEIRLSVLPVLLGGGISLFGEDGPTRRLSLRATTTFDDGIVELRYAVGE